MTTVRPATPADFIAYCGELVETHALEHDGRLLAISVIMRQSGRLWATLDVRPGVNALVLVRAIRAARSRLGEPIYVECQSHAYETAERLLRIIGFVPTQERRKGMGVWVYG